MGKKRRLYKASTLHSDEVCYSTVYAYVRWTFSLSSCFYYLKRIGFYSKYQNRYWICTVVYCCVMFSRNTFLNGKHGHLNCSMISLNDLMWWELRPEFQEITEGFVLSGTCLDMGSNPQTQIIFATCEGRTLTSSSLRRKNCIQVKDHRLDKLLICLGIYVMNRLIHTSKYALMGQSLFSPDVAHSCLSHLQTTQESPFHLCENFTQNVRISKRLWQGLCQP